MTSPEWFRRTTWTDNDQVAFDERLGRSRSRFHKAQYLRIQAEHLYEAGGEPLTLAALELLARLERDAAEESQLAPALCLKGLCLIDLGRVEEAITALRAALEQERRAPSWKTEAYLDLSELLLQLRRSEEYPSVLGWLDEFGGHEVFPASIYRHAVARALLARAAGDQALAGHHARRAVAAASMESPFPRHRTVGLVRFVDPQVIADMQALCDTE